MSIDGRHRRPLGASDTVVLIPVRLDSKRLPNKALRTIRGKPLFWWPYSAAKQAQVARSVDIVTPDVVVGQLCLSLAVSCAWNIDQPDPPTGSDRIAAHIVRWPDNEPPRVVINLQCDEAQIRPEDLVALAEHIWTSRLCQVATLACELTDEDRTDPNVVKVLLDARGHALYFTRAAVPRSASCLGHVGVYAFRWSALESYARYPRGALEVAENLEQLRLLEEGVPIDVVKIPGTRRSVNTERDLQWLENESFATT